MRPRNTKENTCTVISACGSALAWCEFLIFVACGTALKNDCCGENPWCFFVLQWMQKIYVKKWNLLNYNINTCSWIQQRKIQDTNNVSSN